LWVICGTTVVSLGGVLAFVHETHPPERRVRAGGMGRSYAPLLTPRFLGNALAFSLAFAAMMAYISASPFFFQVVMGLSVLQYGLVFALVALVLSAVGMLSAHLATRLPARHQVRLGLLGLLAGSSALAGVVVLALPVAWTLVPILVAVGSLGFVLGGATSSALAAVPGATGAGSAVLGALSFGLGALAVPLVGLHGEQCARPMAFVMVVAAILALASFLFADWGAELKDSPAEGCACDVE
ncbi:MAG TPA: MFS transporter, partial [Holophaga sp.]|nr:MFS transporter [Holophaga sp.]